MSSQSPATHETLTPMMRQYLEIKSQNQEAIVFYRLGDFYEMFYDDAIEASRILELTLTARNKNSETPVPMCGVPYHAAENYLAKLIRHGKKVVICDQTEDAANAKGLVKREITRVLTPGTVLEDNSLSAKTNNFILTITGEKNSFWAVLCDVTTGQIEFLHLSDLKTLADELSRQPVREVIYPENLRAHKALQALLANQNGLYHHAEADLYFEPSFATDKIRSYYHVENTFALGLEANGAIAALGGLLSYLADAKLLTPGLISHPIERRVSQHMILDETTVTHLELFNTTDSESNKGSLAWHMDQCITTMGSRHLASLIRYPLLDVSEIENRLEAIQTLLEQNGLLSGLRTDLQSVSDIERIVNKFIVARASARDALALKDSLIQADRIQDRVANISTPLLKRLKEGFQDFSYLRKKIEKTIQPDAPLGLKEGGLIQEGVDAELDELRSIEKNGKTYILEIEAREKQRTGIGSLKIRYNQVFGYYIEITHTHQDKVPADYIRKQTLANAERYITPELKTYEAKVLGAGERIRNLEYEIFTKLRDDIAARGPELKILAQSLAWLDTLQSLAYLAQTYRYSRPKISNESRLELIGARHPIIERLNLGEPFVPNDIVLDSTDVSEIIITGPNMAGKSTIMRMTALIALMAQIGSYVPCSEALIGISDRIFTRVGAKDSLQKGLSTFMVEMVETAKILREATPKSLIVLDEIGRGTSTFDGLSIAWAVAEDLHDRLHARTLFATHYHELCDLAATKRGIRNAHMQVQEYKNQIVFLRKFVQGGTNRSYGVTVAHMAGLPASVIKRAREVLQLIEKKDLSFLADVGQKDHAQPSLFETPSSTPKENSQSEIVERLKQVDINTLTPISALNLLAELKNLTA